MRKRMRLTTTLYVVTILLDQNPTESLPKNAKKYPSTNTVQRPSNSTVLHVRETCTDRPTNRRGNRQVKDEQTSKQMDERTKQSVQTNRRQQVVDTCEQDMPVKLQTTRHVLPTLSTKQARLHCLLRRRKILETGCPLHCPDMNRTHESLQHKASPNYK